MLCMVMLKFQPRWKKYFLACGLATLDQCHCLFLVKFHFQKANFLLIQRNKHDTQEREKGKDMNISKKSKQ